MQLASRVAVGLAMFLLAILLPVFLVAWKMQDDRGGGECKNAGSVTYLCEVSRQANPETESTLVRATGRGIGGAC